MDMIEFDHKFDHHFKSGVQLYWQNLYLVFARRQLQHPPMTYRKDKD